MRVVLTGIVLLLCLRPYISCSQDNPDLVSKISNFPTSFFHKASAQAASLDQRMEQQTEKYLQQLAKKEAKLKKRLFKQDSTKAKQLFGPNTLDYNTLLQRLHSVTGTATGAVSSGTGSLTGSVTARAGLNGTTYIPSLDTLKTSLKFLQQNPQLFSNSAAWQGQASGTLAQYNQLQNRIQVTSQIQQLIQQRRDQLKTALLSYNHLPPSLQNSYQGYSQQAYYYGAQMRAYQAQLSSPDKLTQQALSILQQKTSFNSFFKSNSDISSMFGNPTAAISTTSAKALVGLQTRTAVQSQLQGQLSGGGANGMGLVQQKIQLAKAQLAAWKQQALQAGGGNSAIAIPDFKPNTQKTKTLWQRLTWGLNLQSLPSTYVFPATSTLGASLGYRLNDKSTIGVGASYVMGWGKDIGHISITSQGAGLRSYFETKIKGSFYAYDGFEYNYQQIIYSLGQINNLNYWTKSGLVGVSKHYRVSAKLQGELQLLFDFISYEQVPKTQPILFRVGYNF